MGISGRIAAYFLQSRLTPLLGLLALLLGLFAVAVTPREEEPQINVTMANVLLPFPGASAADVDVKVAGPMEQMLSQLDGLEHVYSVSRPGMAVLTVQFKVGVPRETALVRLHDALRSHRNVLAPELGVGEPLIRPMGIDDVPVVSLTLWAASFDQGAYEVERVANALQAELKRVSGTREVSVIGGPGRVLRVELDPDRLRAAGLSALAIQAALQSANARLPAGHVVHENRDIVVETGDFFRTRAELENLVVAVRDARPVYLSDVAVLRDGPAQPTRYVWHGLGAVAGKNAGMEYPAVTLTVSKKPGENAVDIATALLERVDSLKGTVIPDDVNVSVTRNYGETANEKAQKLIQKLIFATLSVIALVFFVLGRREAAIVGTAVLLTLAATLFASWAWGFTLNRVSLFALIFSIGILVDDAIVVVENIHRRMAMNVSAEANADGVGVKSALADGQSQNVPEPMAMNVSAEANADGVGVKSALADGQSQNAPEPMAMNVSAEANADGVGVKSALADGQSQNAPEPMAMNVSAEANADKFTNKLPLSKIIPLAVDEVGGPTILATFTVIAALLPMAFVSGLMGPYMSPIPINASMGMLISLGIAFVITPWLAYRLLSRVQHAAHETQAEDKQTLWLRHYFQQLMQPFLSASEGRSRRHKLYWGIVGLIVLSIGLGLMKWVVLKMLPFDNKSEFQVVVDMKAGTSLEDTAALLHDMGAYLATVPEVTDYQAYAGTAAPINFNGLVRQYYLRADSEQGDLQVNLVGKHDRDRKSHEIAEAVRPALEKLAKAYDAHVKVVEVPPGPPVMSPIVAEIYGPDEAGRREVAKAVRAVFERTPDIVAIDDSLLATAPQERLMIDRNRAMLVGVSPQQIAATLRIALSGSDATSLMTIDARDSVPVRLMLSPSSQRDLDAALRMTVTASDGREIPLASLVQRRQEVRESFYYRKDLLPVSYVVGDMAGNLDSPLYGMFAMRSVIDDINLPHGAVLKEYFTQAPSDPYRSYSIKWDGEWQVTYETFRDMGAAYAVGMVLIYLLVVAQFGSYSVPLVIMSPIPLTLIGVMPGHALLGAQFTATSMIGMIALAGIIVRNSILLVDFINLKLADGMALADAVIEASAARTKPIVLTGLAAMMGAFFILDDPIFNGLAISLIFGILVSTMLTLLLIPVLYYALLQRQAAKQTA